MSYYQLEGNEWQTMQGQPLPYSYGGVQQNPSNQIEMPSYGQKSWYEQSMEAGKINRPYQYKGRTYPGTQQKTQSMQSTPLDQLNKMINALAQKTDPNNIPESFRNDPANQEVIQKEIMNNMKNLMQAYRLKEQFEKMAAPKEEKKEISPKLIQQPQKQESQGYMKIGGEKKLIGAPPQKQNDFFTQIQQAQTPEELNEIKNNLYGVPAFSVEERSLKNNAISLLSQKERQFEEQLKKQQLEKKHQQKQIALQQKQIREVEDLSSLIDTSYNNNTLDKVITKIQKMAPSEIKNQLILKANRKAGTFQLKKRKGEEGQAGSKYEQKMKVWKSNYEKEMFGVNEKVSDYLNRIKKSDVYKNGDLSEEDIVKEVNRYKTELKNEITNRYETIRPDWRLQVEAEGVPYMGHYVQPRPGTAVPPLGAPEEKRVKQMGFLGKLERPDKKYSTELSIGINFDGEEREIPLLVPTLNKQEVDFLLEGNEPTREIINKAVDHARERIKQNKSPFAQTGVIPEEIKEPEPIDDRYPNVLQYMFPAEQEVKPLMKNIVESTWDEIKKDPFGMFTADTESAQATMKFLDTIKKTWNYAGLPKYMIDGIFASTYKGALESKKKAMEYYNKKRKKEKTTKKESLVDPIILEEIRKKYKNKLIPEKEIQNLSDEITAHPDFLDIIGFQTGISQEQFPEMLKNKNKALMTLPELILNHVASNKKLSNKDIYSYSLFAALIDLASYDVDPRAQAGKKVFNKIINKLKNIKLKKVFKKAYKKHLDELPKQIKGGPEFVPPEDASFAVSDMPPEAPMPSNLIKGEKPIGKAIEQTKQWMRPVQRIQPTQISGSLPEPTKMALPAPSARDMQRWSIKNRILLSEEKNPIHLSEESLSTIKETQAGKYIVDKFYEIRGKIRSQTKELLKKELKKKKEIEEKELISKLYNMDPKDVSMVKKGSTLEAVSSDPYIPDKRMTNYKGTKTPVGEYIPIRSLSMPLEKRLNEKSIIKPVAKVSGITPNEQRTIRNIINDMKGPKQDKDFVSSVIMEKVIKDKDFVFYNDMVELNAGLNLSKPIASLYNGIKKATAPFVENLARSLLVKEDMHGLEKDPVAAKRYIDNKNDAIGKRNYENFKDSMQVRAWAVKMGEAIGQNTTLKRIMGKGGKNYNRLTRALYARVSLENTVGAEEGSLNFLIEEYIGSNKISKKWKQALKDAYDENIVTPEFQEMLGEMTNTLKERGERLKEAGVISEMQELYAPQFWEQEEPDFIFLGSSKKSPRTSHSRKRSFRNIFEGMIYGKKLAIEDPLTAWHKYTMNTNNAYHNKVLKNNLKEMKTSDGRSVLSNYDMEGYERIENKKWGDWIEQDHLAMSSDPRFKESPQYKDYEHRRDIFVTDDGRVFKQEPLYALKGIAKNLNNIFGSSKLWDVPGFKDLMKLTSFTKKMVLSASGFHVVALSRSGVAAGINPLNATKFLTEELEKNEPTIKLLIEKGLTMSETNPNINQVTKKMKTHLGKLIDEAGVLGENKKMMEAFLDQYTGWMFGDFQGGLKTLAGVKHFEAYRNNPKFAHLTDGEIAEQIATHLNNDFGGLNLEKMGMDPTFTSVTRALLFAPDWSISNAELVFDAFMGNPIQKDLARKALARIILGSLALAPALSYTGYALRHGAKKGGQEYLKALKEEGPGWLFYADITPIIEAYKGKDLGGVRKGISIVGHFDDALELVFDPIGLAKKKMTIPTRWAEQLTTGRKYGAFKFTDWNEIWKKGLYSYSTKDIGKPITASQAPSFMMSCLTDTMPIPMKSTARFIHDMFKGSNKAAYGAIDLLGDVSGVHVTTRYPKKKKWVERNEGGKLIKKGLKSISKKGTNDAMQELRKEVGF